MQRPYGTYVLDFRVSFLPCVSNASQLLDHVVIRLIDVLRTHETDRIHALELAQSVSWRMCATAEAGASILDGVGKLGLSLSLIHRHA